MYTYIIQCLSKLLPYQFCQAPTRNDRTIKQNYIQLQHNVIKLILNKPHGI